MYTCIYYLASFLLPSHLSFKNMYIYTCIMQEYKPPASKDIPIDFRIALLKNAPNPIGILGSKGIVSCIQSGIL